jgi:hypothetical protein
MQRQTTEYLTGFGRAAQLVRRVLAEPPCFKAAPEYVESVAALHAGTDDMFCRGLAVGCLAALGR